MIFLFHWFVKITGWLPYRLLLRTKITYEDKRVQRRHIKGSAIIVSNHRKVLDVALPMFTFVGRTLRCAVAELMFKKNIFMRVFLHALGAVKVDRNAHDFSFLSDCERILSRGGVVEIYPESRLPLAEEERPLPFKPSAVYLALQTGAPIIPICHNGRYFEKRRMRVLVGKPIDVRSMYREDLSEKENVAYITEQIRGKIVEFQKQLEQQEEAEARR